MPTVLRVDGFAFRVIPGDDDPPHVHVRYGGTRCKIVLETLQVKKGTMKVADRTWAVRIVAEHREELLRIWNDFKTQRGWTMKNVYLTEEEAARIVAESEREVDHSDEIEPRAVKAWYDAGRGLVMFEMKNRCVFGFPPPPERYWGLNEATPGQLAQVETEEGGEVLTWEEIDADISVPGLLLHLLNVKAWYAKWLGGSKSEAKAAAARENGKKGGRPRKKTVIAKSTGRRKTAQAGD